MLFCYVVAFELLVATFLSFWLLHCYILTFNLSGFPFLFCPFNWSFFPLGLFMNIVCKVHLL
jgi:hypothetical protein